MVSFFHCLPSVFAAIAYQPQYGDSLLESWRWTEFPEFGSKSVTRMTQAPDGSLWMSGACCVIHYNGFESIVYDSILGRTDHIFNQICVGKDNDVFAFSGKTGLLRFYENTWGKVDIKKELLAGRNQMLFRRNGDLCFAGIYGIVYKLDDTYQIFRPDGICDVSNIDVETLELFDVAKLSEASNGDIWCTGAMVRCFAAE